MLLRFVTRSLLAVAACGSCALAGELPDILGGDRDGESPYLPDFSYAGYHNGVRALPVASGTVIAVAAHGARADDGIDDSRAILAALAAANDIDGPVVVRFDAGRYIVSDVLPVVRSNIVLRGAGSGPGGTQIHFPRPLAHVDDSDALDELRQYIRDLDKRQREKDANIDEYFSEYSWSGGFIWVQKPGTRSAPYLESYDPEIDTLTAIESARRGERTLQVRSSRRLAAGDVVQIQWINDQGPDAALIDEIYDDPDIEVGSHHWTFEQRPLVRQSARIVAVDGTRVTLADPLLHDVSDAIPASIAAWSHLVEVGIEDLHLSFPPSPYFGHHLEAGYNGIYLTSVFDAWIRNVRITHADSGILTYNSANVTLRDIVTDGNRKAHYGVHMGNVHNVLAERISVFNPVLHSLTFNTQSTKCVYKQSRVYAAPTLDQHAGANHQNLFDNVTLFVSARRTDDGPAVTVFDGSGAGYWQPGHGAFNTTWNLRVHVLGGAYADETVLIEGLDEGPAARIVGLHGNRRFTLDYRPEPYVESLNEAVRAVPSLYDYQLLQRLAAQAPAD